MKALEKISSACSLVPLPKPADSGPAFDLARLVSQPRHSPLASATVAARMLVGVLTVGQDANDAGLCMEIDGTQVSVQVAASCLLRVEAGDWVQAVVAGSEVWVLSVLKKNESDCAAARQLDFGESELHISAKKISLSARDHIDIRAPLLTQTANNRQSHIDGTDSARVGNSLLHADSHLSLHARSAMVTAASLLKVDAAQIHMG